jgi:hypothetical protein
MKRAAQIFGVVLLPGMALGLALHDPAASSSAQTPAKTAVPVVVELFTSEGCSTCPPADAFLTKLETQQPIPNAQVIALEEHVDYWNNQGWVDPFSDPEWTTRQQDYAGRLGNENIYTPQMVVDGRTQFVGSREDQARQAIVAAAASATTAVSIAPAQAGTHGGAQFAVTVGKLAGGKSDKADVWLAVTESGLHSAVARGENAGKEVYHASIVRTLRKVGTADSNKDTAFSENVSIPLKPYWKPDNLRVVVFVQDKKNHQILGAAVTPFK